MVKVSRYRLTRRHIASALDILSTQDGNIAAALETVGYPEERRRDAGFDALVRIIVGQQVSTKAASAIASRLTDTLGGTIAVASVAAATDEQLRGAGLSRQKVSYLRALESAVTSGDLPVDSLGGLSDAEVVARITAVKGFGEWSAHMYLMFSLGRCDVWPTGDLAVRAGFGRMMGMDERPTPKQTLTAAEPFAPYRSALALLCWRYYSEAPL